MEHEWQPMSVSEAATRFAPAGITWWIAGGYAIDLFLGWETRPHSDLDVEIFRRDSSVLFDIFDGWDIHVVAEGRLERWTNPDDLARDVFGVWLRPGPREPWQVEIMLTDGDYSQWRFRREPSITMPGDRLIRFTPYRIPYCTPEVQLLYKASAARSKDDVDLARCLHRMTTSQRTWLAEALPKTSPEHPWIKVLSASLGGFYE